MRQPQVARGYALWPKRRAAFGFKGLVGRLGNLVGYLGGLAGHLGDRFGHLWRIVSHLGGLVGHLGLEVSSALEVLSATRGPLALAWSSCGKCKVYLWLRLAVYLWLRLPTVRPAAQPGPARPAAHGSARGPARPTAQGPARGPARTAAQGPAFRSMHHNGQRTVNSRSTRRSTRGQHTVNTTVNI